VSAAPWLAVISRHKELAFGASGLLMALNCWLVVVRPRQCQPGDLCHVDGPLMRWNRRVFWASVGIYVTALVVTYGALLWLQSS